MHFCGHVFSVVTDKYLLNGSILIAGIVIFCRPYGEKYYVIIKHSQAYLTKNCHMHLDALKNFYIIIINIIFCGGYFLV